MGERALFFKSSAEKLGSEEKEIYLKTRFIAMVCVAVILTTGAVTIYSLWTLGLGRVSAIGTSAFMAMVVSFGFLMKGRHTIAVHILFISGFISLWAVLFFEVPIPLIKKLDTIVLIIGLFSSMAISVFNSLKPIAFYFGMNVMLLILLVYHLTSASILLPSEGLEYFLDNMAALCFVFFVVISAFVINKKVIISLKNELEMRKKTQKAHQEVENKLMDHLNNTPVAAIFWDLDFKVTQWNPSAQRIFGYTKEEALGKHVHDLILPSDVKDTVDQIFRELLSGRGGERHINDNITKEGKRIICDWYNSVLKSSEGKIIGMASLVNDITEKTKIQEMMIQSAKMMSVGGLAAGMAHEIKNPLAGVIQNAQVVYNRLAQDLAGNETMARQLGLCFSDIRSYAEKRGILNQLELISDAGRRGVKIIENMLSFSRKSVQVREPAKLCDLVENTIALAKNDSDLKKKYNFRSIEIKKEFNLDLPMVYCEISKIQQVLFNLFTNACDAINMKTYHNETPRLILRMNQGDNNIRIEIEDNGVGMEKETKDHIFEPFFTTKNKQGTGLGLSISYYIIVEDHGGQMSVESFPGQGSRFLIDLPFRKENGRSGDIISEASSN
ncbi:MAG: PAS domain S-box protein [Proteobacteria bacterium]|nr:PAS domain S-box protein [Pseudomonadota bacterium]MBU1388443.1 PAS domain S-box protein [Pseudomonadota bacterium]MBU1542733.1 PAS domain S-box protein [Pseudomonadota bacterium]MBU2481267.1 PAS domain S-box protein [Pseudomonadota bacterium]